MRSTGIWSVTGASSELMETDENLRRIDQLVCHRS